MSCASLVQSSLTGRTPVRSVCLRHTHRHGASRRAAGKIIEATGEELEVALAERDKPMVIDFYADWCGPCILLADELKKVAEEMEGAVAIYKVNTDKNDDLATQLQIQGLPTMIFVGMDASKPALRTEGLLPAQSIINIVNTELLGIEPPPSDDNELQAPVTPAP